MISRRQLPYEFTSQYSPRECVERLDAKQGNYIDTSIAVQFKEIDSDTCKFRLTVNAPSTRNQGPVNKHYDGIIQDRGEEGTLIRINNTGVSFLVYLRIVIVCIVAIWIVFGAFSNQAQLIGGTPALLFIAFGGAFVFLITGSLRLNSIDDQIIDLLEDTLIRHEPPEDNSLQGKFNRLLNLGRRRV